MKIQMNKLTLLTIVKINWFNMLNLIFILEYEIEKLWEEVDLGNCYLFFTRPRFTETSI